MSNLGKAGSILTIIGSAFMVVLGFYLLISGFRILRSLDFGILLTFSLLSLILGITNIILSSLALSGRKRFAISSAILAIISIFLAWVLWIFPLILLLLGGIFLLIGRNNTKEQIKEEKEENKDVIIDWKISELKEIE